MDTYLQLTVALSPEEYEKIGIFLELTSGFVPGFSLRLVRQWIHVASVYASVSSPEEYEKIEIFLGDDFWICSRFFVMLGSTVDTFCVSLHSFL